ncbi:MAG: penicillin-binding protein 1C, partial [Candidatus Riflebacteria bacterium HGW-Riflebacteria-2]
MLSSHLKGTWRIWSITAFVLFCLAAAGFIAAARQVRHIGIESFRDVRASYRVSDAVLLDRHKEVIHTLRTDLSGRRLEWARLEDVSPSFLETVILAEDRRFPGHHGVDLLAFMSALAHNATRGRLRGASTISMQLAAVIDRDLRPRGTRRGLGQKWRQVIAALALERSWKKDEILEAYINLISYRGELQGVRAASKGLFGKEPSGLTRVESIVRASLITSPNAPRERVAVRSWRLAQRAGMKVARDEVEKATGEALASAYRIGFDASLAPHVARMVLAAGQVMEITTLDGRLQRFAL